MPARLVSLSGFPNITLGQVLSILGRERDVDVRVTSSRVSRRHCCLVLIDRGVMVRDLRSTNGTFINDVRIAEGTLKEGDTLGIGNLRYRIELASTEDSRAREMPDYELPSSSETDPESKMIADENFRETHRDSSNPQRLLSTKPIVAQVQE